MNSITRLLGIFFMSTASLCAISSVVTLNTAYQVLYEDNNALGFSFLKNSTRVLYPKFAKFWLGLTEEKKQSYKALLSEQRKRQNDSDEEYRNHKRIKWLGYGSLAALYLSGLAIGGYVAYSWFPSEQFEPTSSVVTTIASVVSCYCFYKTLWNQYPNNRTAWYKGAAYRSVMALYRYYFYKAHRKDKKEGATLLQLAIECV